MSKIPSERLIEILVDTAIQSLMHEAGPEFFAIVKWLKTKHPHVLEEYKAQVRMQTKKKFELWFDSKG